MLEWLKRFFIPHVGNAYRPHFLLGHNIRQLLALVIGFETILFLLPFANFTTYFHNLNLTSVLPGILSTLTNEERAKSNLPTLVENPILSRAAELKAEDMARKGYFAHTSPEGKTPWYWLDLVGYKYNFAGENLAINFIDSKDVTDAWMNSPTHRANIVGRSYVEMGTGIATGIYEGRETVFVAQVYASPGIPAQQSNFHGFTRQNPTGSDTDENLPVAPSQKTSTEVLGEAVPTQLEPTFIEETLSSPREAMNAVLYVVLAIIIVALFLNIVIKFEYQYPDLITNGMLVVVVVFGLFISNSYLAEKNIKTTFIAYEAPQAQKSLSQ